MMIQFNIIEVNTNMPTSYSEGLKESVYITNDDPPKNVIKYQRDENRSPEISEEVSRRKEAFYKSILNKKDKNVWSNKYR